MTPKIHKNLALVGAIALGGVFMALPAKAQTTFVQDTAQTINVNAVVQNSIDVTVVEPDAGTLGVLASTTPGDAASLTIDPDGTIDDSSAIDGGSRIVNDGTAVPGSFTIAAGDAFGSTAIYTTYSALTDLTCTAGCTATEDIILTAVLDDLNTATATACPASTAVAGTVTTAPATTTGCGTTAADGSLTINVGYTIETVDGAGTRPVYEDGTYVGSFDAIIQY